MSVIDSLGLAALAAVVAAAQVWAYLHGRIGRPWKLFDFAEPMNRLGPLALFVLPSYLLGRAHPRVRTPESPQRRRD